jgi:hypothetical protein
VGMACGFSIELYLWLGTHVAWTWWVMIGTSVTFFVGWTASMLLSSSGNVRADS